jgi:iron complex outermembrane recepter protein
VLSPITRILLTGTGPVLAGPSPGLFGPLLQPGELVPRDSPTHWNDYAAFVEDVIDLAVPVKLVTGARYDRLELDRQNFNTQGVELSNGFTQTYSSTNWRVGLVYNVNDYLTPYVSWTTGKDPSGATPLLGVSSLR